MLKSSLRSLFRALPLLVYRAATGGLPIVTGLAIARIWGLEELAAFTVANAAIAVAMVMADWGAQRALPRNLVTLGPEAAAEMLGSANAVRALLVVLLAAGGLVAGAAGWIDADVARYFAILFPVCPLFLVATNALSERVVSGQTQAVGLAVFAGLTVFAAGAIAVVVLHRGPHLFAAAYVLGKAVETFVIAWKRGWTLSLHFRSFGSTAAALWPFSAQVILGVIYSRAAVFTVERMTTRAELGVFSVAIAMQSALYMIPGTNTLSHFPELTRMVKEKNARGVRRVLVHSAATSLAMVLAGLAFLFLFARRITGALKVPPAYVPFVLAFASIAVLAVFSTVIGFLMQAQGREKTAARLSVITLTLALIYQVAALSAFGLWGIVVAVAAAEITTLIVFGPALGYKAPQ